MKKFYRSVVLSVLSAAVLTSVAYGQDKLPDGISAVNGIDPSLSDSDLVPLKNLIGKAHYIGIGESDHGSGGFLEAKFRLIKFMVEKLGVRAVVFETNRLDAQNATRYVNGGSGTAENALKGFFGVWWDQNILDLLKWLRTFNESHPFDRVSLFGMDMQDPYNSGPAIKKFLEKIVPEQSDYFFQNIKSCFGATVSADTYQAQVKNILYGQYSISENEYNTCLSGLSTVEQLIKSRNQQSSKISSKTLALAEVSIVALRASEKMCYNILTHFGVANEARDEAMFFTLRTLKSLYFPHKRVVISAHNAHLGAAFDDSSGVYNGVKLFGVQMGKQFGTDYAPIGLAGYDVKSHWEVVPAVPKPTASNAIELMLHNLGFPYLLLNTTSKFLIPDKPYQMNLNALPISLNLQANYRAIFFLDTAPAGKKLNLSGSAYTLY